MFYVLYPFMTYLLTPPRISVRVTLYSFRPRKVKWKQRLWSGTVGLRAHHCCVTSWNVSLYKLPYEALSSWAVVSNGGMANERWFGRDLTGSCRSLEWSTIPKFSWMDWRKLREKLVRIGDVLAEIRSRHLPITSRHPHDNPFSLKLLKVVPSNVNNCRKELC
jgi:hypothetical protein